ncbi:MAG: PAS domain S-box protein, partial [Calditrichaceae bacterium]
NLEKKTPVKNKIPVFNEKLLNALSDGFLILNEKYEHILVNKALCKITGYSRKELISVKPPFPYWPADKTDESTRAFSKILNGQLQDYELILKHKNGRQFPVIINASKIRLPADETVNYFVTIVDITNLKNLEEDHLLNQFIIDHASISIFRVGEDAAIQYVNEQACKSLGYTKEELCSMSIFDIDPVIKKDQWPDFEEFIKNKKSNTLESIHKRKDGSTFPVYITADYLKYHDKNYSISFTQDISERKKAENTILDSEKRYRLLFELESDAIFLIDNVSGRIMEANNAAAEMYGYSREELTSVRNTDLSAEPTDTRRVTTSNTPNANQVVHIPLRYHRKKDGTVFPVEITGRFFIKKGRSVHIAAISDITERLKTENQMRDLAKFPEENPNPVMRISNEGKVIYANEASSILLHFWETGLNRILPEKWKHINERVLNEKTDLNLEVDCESRTYTLIFTYVREGDYVNIYGLDITEQKLLEEQLRQSQKMEAIGHLAGGIAHDFNNLLTVINGYSELMLTEFNKSDPFYDKINQILQSGQRAESLTRQLLAFSRRQILQPVDLDVNKLLQEMEKMLERIIGENIILKTFYDENLMAIKADPGQIEQVVINLVINSRDALPHGGEIVIETANVMLDEDYVRYHAEVEPGMYVLISVKDNGTGMDKSTLSHIFEPFFTTKDEHKGTGLGLSTVYGIIKQSEGNIQVKSEPGKGTTVHIYLKASDHKLTKSYKIPESDIDIEGKESVLVVEDEQAVREFTALILRRFGYTVLEASGPEEALNIIHKKKTDFDILLTDVIMPVMTGKELAEKIQQLQNGIRVIYMSGYTDDIMVHQEILDDNMAFIQKPFTSLSLLKKLREVLTEKPNKQK